MRVIFPVCSEVDNALFGLRKIACRNTFYSRSNDKTFEISAQSLIRVVVYSNLMKKSFGRYSRWKLSGRMYLQILVMYIVYFRWSGAEVSAADVAGGAASSRRAGRSLRHGRG